MLSILVLPGESFALPSNTSALDSAEPVPLFAHEMRFTDQYLVWLYPLNTSRLPDARFG